MRSWTLALMATAVSAATPRYLIYFDEWHTESLPSKEETAGINYITTAFAKSDIFNTGTDYKPFMPVADVRKLFDDGAKVCMAVGGWGDTKGFGVAAATEESRKTFAKNVATALDNLGYDCVDIDWEYPGGNGEDYKQITNDKKTSEIETYPQLLSEIKAAIGTKELSIATPGREPDYIAYTAEQVPKISEAVDFVNVMAYDLMNRRDNQTLHMSGLQDSKQTVQRYLDLGMPASKINLGLPFYAKFFQTQGECKQAVGCPTVEMEDAKGGDTGKSGAVTFSKAEASNPGLKQALEKGKLDAEQGGMWWWDPATKNFWTWDSPELISRKIEEIVKPMGLGGIFAWSLGEDSNGYSRVKAMREGFQSMSKTSQC
ncbi:hypothetical protein CDD81_6547 [Ophiocordyceps australis]|uniref:chitinase n=1 Tax=Ophiocordyceps australis TaxID=1399860 RepID=A0A2C5Y7H8_9HYPO|nr:hypothetical protein CDD81_6547 [Ophiocordyceps australis]